MVSLFPNPPHALCLSVVLASFSVALIGEAGDDFSLVWCVAAEEEALGVLVFFSWVAAGVVGIALPKMEVADGTVEFGFVLAAAAGA